MRLYTFEDTITGEQITVNIDKISMITDHKADDSIFIYMDWRETPIKHWPFDDEQIEIERDDFLSFLQWIE